MAVTTGPGAAGPVAGSGQRWRVRPGPPLRWQSWDDHSFVFDPVSGDTHFLDAAAAEALRCLEGGAVLGRSELARALLQRLELGSAEANVDRYVGEFITRCERLGIIEADVDAA